MGYSFDDLFMRRQFRFPFLHKQIIGLLLLLIALPCIQGKAQYRFIRQAPATERLQSLWQYCSQNLISDRDSATTCKWLEGVESVADSLHDTQLMAYATYFRICFRVLFSKNYDQYFAKGDYEGVANVYRKAQAWAKQNGHPDIETACEHYIGEVYYYAAQYKPAFEYLLRADDRFREIGYENIPAISTYLYDLALNYYKFKEWDKALHYFMQATHYPFFAHWTELSTLNSIGLIYFNNRQWAAAIPYYRQTIARAYQYKDNSWVGIASGNLGNVFTQQGRYDSALLYHILNFRINQADRAPEDAAWSALAIAELYIHQNQPDSATQYINRGQTLATASMRDSAARLSYQKDWLLTLIALHKKNADYQMALYYADSMAVVSNQLQQLLDGKVIKEAEAKRYIAEISLLQTEKRFARLRLYVFIAALLLVGVGVVWGFNRYRLRKRQQIAKAALEKEKIQVEKQRVEAQLQRAEQSLMAYLQTIKEKTSLIESLDHEIQRLKEVTSPATNLEGLTGNMEKLVSATILTEEGWNYFKDLFEQVYPGFIGQLQKKYTNLSPAETRMFILTRLNLSSREMAHMLGISMDSLRKARYRLRKKLNLEEETGLEVLVQQL